MGLYVFAEPDVKLFVEDLNPKGQKTIVWIHGWPGSHDLFEYQFDVFPKMGYRCVGMDCRGFGQSDKPWGGYDYNRLADDVRSVVDALQLKDFTLGGHSTGGAIAIRYMARHNGYGVSRLGLFAAAAPSLIQRPNFPYGISRQAVLDIIAGTESDRPKMLQDFGKTIFYNPVTVPFSDWIFNLGLQAAGWATAAVANTWLKEELFEDMRKISVPTLILNGLQDKVCLFPLAETQKSLIKNSRLVPFENCGHFLFYDQREKFNKELMQFAQ
jgi:non-heme chloroperoxidase